MSNPVLTVPPVSLPVTLDELKEHCRVDGSNEDALMLIYLNGAISHLDGAHGSLGRALLPQTWAETFPRFCQRMRLAVAPVSAIVAVTYLDSAEVEQTVDPALYLIDRDDLVFGSDFDWPETAGGVTDIEVEYVAGYATLPDDLRNAVLVLAGELYEHREATMAGPVSENRMLRAMLDKYRRGWAA